MRLISIIITILVLNSSIFAEAESNSGNNSGLNAGNAGEIIDNSRNSLFTGDVNLSVPILNIAGISLNLNYNSNLIKKITLPFDYDSRDFIGVGWTFEPGAITADRNGTAELEDDTYYIIGPSGQREKLIPEGNNYYKLKNYQYWEIKRITGDVYGEEETKIYGWIITIEDGTKLFYGSYDWNTPNENDELNFIFGYDDRHTMCNASRYVIGWNDIIAGGVSDNQDTERLFGYRWDMSAVKDIHDNYVKIKYDQYRDYLTWYDDGNYKQSKHRYTIHVYPQTIIYNNDYSKIKLFTTKIDYDDGDYDYYRRLSRVEYSNNDKIYNKLYFSYTDSDPLNRDISKAYLTSVYNELNDGSKTIDTRFEYYGVNETESGDIINHGAIKKVTTINGKETLYEYGKKQIARTNLRYTNDFDIDELDKTKIKTGDDFAVVYKKANASLSFNGSIDIYIFNKGKNWIKDAGFPAILNADNPCLYNVYTSDDYIVFEIGNEQNPDNRNSSVIKIVNRLEEGWGAVKEIITAESRNIFRSFADMEPAYFIVETKENDNRYLYSVEKDEQGNWTLVENILVTYHQPSNDRVSFVKTSNNYFVIAKNYWVDTECSNPPFCTQYHDVLRDQWNISFYLRDDNGWIEALKESVMPTGHNPIIYLHKSYAAVVENYNKLILYFKDPGQKIFEVNNSLDLSFGGIERFKLIPDNGVIYLNRCNRSTGFKSFSYIDIQDKKDIASYEYDGFYYFRGELYNQNQFLYSYFDESMYSTYYKIAERNANGEWDFDNAKILYRESGEFTDKRDGLFPFTINHRIFGNLEGDNIGDAPFYIDFFYYKNSDYTSVEIERQYKSDYKFESVKTGDDFLAFTSYKQVEIIDDDPQPEKDDPKEYEYYGTLNLAKTGFNTYCEEAFSGSPYHFPVVKIETTDKQSGQSSAVQFEYEDGVFDNTISYVKYNRVKQILPGSNGYVVSYFYNDLSSVDGSQFEDLTVTINGVGNAGYLLDGLKYRIETYNYDNQLIKQIENKWELLNKDDDSYYIYLKRTEKTDLNNITSKKEFEYYEDNGQKKKEIVYKTNSDDKKLVIDYYYDTSDPLPANHILNWSSKLTIKDKDGKLLKQKEYEYDYSQLFLKSEKVWLDKNNTGVVDSDEMINNKSIEKINGYGQITETKNTINNTYNSVLYDRRKHLPVAIAANARVSEIHYDGFEDGGRWNNTSGSVDIISSKVNVGNKAVKLGDDWSHFKKTLSGNYSSGATFVFSAWIKGKGAAFKIEAHNSGESSNERSDILPSGKNWQLCTWETTLQQDATSLDIYLEKRAIIEDEPEAENEADPFIYCDEFRFYPKDAFMNTTVYDPFTLRAIAAEDEYRNIIRTKYDEAGRFR